MVKLPMSRLISISIMMAGSKWKQFKHVKGIFNQNNFENVPSATSFQNGNLSALLSAEFFKCTALKLAPTLLEKIQADKRSQVCRKNQSQTNFENVPTVAAFQDGNLPALLSVEFFKCTALELAPKLLGKFLRRDDVILQITEVEAYCPNDSACHGRFGITARTAPVFGPAGHAYVYLCYGLHNMLNIVADMEGIGAAVLIRSCAPVAGLKTIQSRRGMVSIKPQLLSGPGKIGQALGLTADWSNHPLYMPGGLEILDGPNPENILVGPRVGIDYANSEDVAAPWRFAISGSPWISAPKNTLKPAPSFTSFLLIS